MPEVGFPSGEGGARSCVHALCGRALLRACVVCRTTGIAPLGYAGPDRACQGK